MVIGCGMQRLRRWLRVEATTTGFQGGGPSVVADGSVVAGGKGQ